jgi:hypothetical protein
VIERGLDDDTAFTQAKLQLTADRGVTTPLRTLSERRATLPARRDQPTGT